MGAGSNPGPHQKPERGGKPPLSHALKAYIEVLVSVY
jgi:hypothetical protein